MQGVVENHVLWVVAMVHRRVIILVVGIVVGFNDLALIFVPGLRIVLWNLSIVISIVI